MKYLTLIFALWCNIVIATPPACFLSCINEVAKESRKLLTDLTSLCAKQEQVLGCLVDICPYGTFESSRDHYFGTCLEHGKPTNGNYPPGYIPGLESQLIPFSPVNPTTFQTTILKPESTTVSLQTSSIPLVESEPLIPEYEDCEWEEEETVDENGWITIVKKPINVPAEYLSRAGTSKKKVIIKHPKLQTSLISTSPSDVEQNDEIDSNTYSRLNRYRKPHTLKTNFLNLIL